MAADLPEGSIEFRGANFSWGSGAWAGQPDVVPESLDEPHPEGSEHKTEASGDTRKSSSKEVSANRQDGVVERKEGGGVMCSPLTLFAPRFTVSSGEFLGVAGEVRSFCEANLGCFH